MLNDKIEFYKETKQTLKNTPAQYKQEYKWLKEVDSLALANEQLHLQTAFKNFFRDVRVGFPKFKSKKHDRKSYTTNSVNNSIRIVSKNHIQLPKLGTVKFKQHRSIPDDFDIKSVTISQAPSGKYFICILTEYEWYKPDYAVDINNSIGLDYSSPNFYVDNNNHSPENYKKLFRLSEQKLAFEQRKLSNMKLHSNNFEKQKVKVAKIHEKIQNQRRDFIEKESYALANKYDVIFVEDLNLQEFSPELHLGKSTYDNGFGMFRTRLQEKLEIQGKQFVKIDKWFPSSKTCRFCGCINKNLQLNDREWDCDCGAHLLRDENAAINIRTFGIRSLEE